MILFNELKETFKELLKERELLDCIDDEQIEQIVEGVLDDAFDTLNEEMAIIEIEKEELKNEN